MVCACGEGHWEAFLRVSTVGTGNGMEACMRLHGWREKHTDMGLVELSQRVMPPNQAKKEYDLQPCIEEWQEAMLDLERVDPDYKELPDAYQVAAVRGLLTGNIGATST